MARACLPQLDDLGTHLAELLGRRGAEPPALLELALLAACSDREAHVHALLDIPGQIEAYWKRLPASPNWPAADAPWEQAHRHLLGIVNAMGKTLPEPVAAPPAGADELRVRLRGNWLTEAALYWLERRTFNDPLVGADANLSHRADLNLSQGWKPVLC